VTPDHSTEFGSYFIGSAERALRSKIFGRYRASVQLILTSPPFPLNHKKKYGNKTGEEYVSWFASFAPLFAELIADNGSIVVELGNAWLPGRPVQSLLNLVHRR
jgi:hypothetical protein